MNSADSDKITYSTRELDIAKETENRLTALESEAEKWRKQIPEMEEKLQSVYTDTRIMEAIKEVTKSQRTTMLLLAGVTFAGISAIVAVIKLF